MDPVLPTTDPLKEELLAEINVFLQRYRMRASRFGQLAVNDHKLINRIRTRPITTTTFARVRSFMKTYDSDRRESVIDESSRT